MSTAPGLPPSHSAERTQLGRRSRAAFNADLGGALLPSQLQPGTLSVQEGSETICSIVPGEGSFKRQRLNPQPDAPGRGPVTPSPCAVTTAAIGYSSATMMSLRSFRHVLSSPSLHGATAFEYRESRVFYALLRFLQRSLPPRLTDSGTESTSATSAAHETFMPSVTSSSLFTATAPSCVSLNSAVDPLHEFAAVFASNNAFESGKSVYAAERRLMVAPLELVPTALGTCASLDTVSMSVDEGAVAEDLPATHPASPLLTLIRHLQSVVTATDLSAGVDILFRSTGGQERDHERGLQLNLDAFSQSMARPLRFSLAARRASCSRASGNLDLSTSGLLSSATKVVAAARIRCSSPEPSIASGSEPVPRCSAAQSASEWRADALRLATTAAHASGATFDECAAMLPQSLLLEALVSPRGKWMPCSFSTSLQTSNPTANLCLLLVPRRSYICPHFPRAELSDLEL